MYLPPGQNRYSKVFVIPAAHSAIVKLSEDKDYFDEVYHLLAIDYGLDVENSAIFYLFDRDRRSNRPKQIIPEFERYGNSRVSMDFGMNGLFLLSYPSIEAYLSTANEDSAELESGDEAKQFVEEKHYLTNEIKEENLLTAATLMISVIEFITGSPFYPELLDDFRDSNKAILKYQDNKWAKDHKYITLSLLSASLIDLGIISMD